MCAHVYLCVTVSVMGENENDDFEALIGKRSENLIASEGDYPHPLKKKKAQKPCVYKVSGPLKYKRIITRFVLKTR